MERLGRLAALGTAAVYEIGLLIVNLNLLQIGVPDFSILRTRYILTGILAIGLLLLLAYFLLLLGAVIKALAELYRQSADMRQGRAPSAEVIFAALLLIGILFLGVLYIRATVHVDLRLPVFSAVFPAIDPILVLSSGLITLLILFKLISNRLRKEPRGLLLGEGPHGLLLPLVNTTTALILLSFAFLYLDLFAATVYPNIPEQFGGGQPKHVQLVLSQGSMDLGAVIGTETSAKRTNRYVDLLWETEQMYVVRDRSVSPHRVIQVDRDEVSAVVLGLQPPPLVTPAASPAPPLATPHAPPTASQ